MQEIEKLIFSIRTEEEFNDLALEIFRIQARENPVYSKFVEYLQVDISKIKRIEDIPFLPIEFFKTKKIVTKYSYLPDNQFVVFKSSGTTAIVRSKHYIYNIDAYEKSFLAGFKQFFGNPQDYAIFGLLPSYLEAGDSSLVYMVKRLMEYSGHKDNDFYLYDYERLLEKIKENEKAGQKMILFGVSYALLDFADFVGKEEFGNLIIIETGGMKGRKKEIVREELHYKLKKSFGLEKICSEYGMTELLSQAYSLGEGLFNESRTMKILIRDVNDPFGYVSDGKSGGINIIDLSNLYSCSFIATQDLGRKDKKGFEVLGRFDNSDIRGCNLLIM